jgi:hypothetical protein
MNLIALLRSGSRLSSRTVSLLERLASEAQLKRIHQVISSPDAQITAKPIPQTAKGKLSMRAQPEVRHFHRAGIQIPFSFKVLQTGLSPRVAPAQQVIRNVRPCERLRWDIRDD